MTQPLEIIDFSGGRTDNYVGGPLNRYKRADNLVAVKHGDVAKLTSRFGSQLYDSNFPLVNPLFERIGRTKNFRTTSGDKLLVFSNTKVYHQDIVSSAWTEITGLYEASGTPINSIFAYGTTTSNVVSFADWNDHLFVTNDQFSPVVKLYNDDSNALQLRTAGLPDLATSPIVTATGHTGKNYLYRFVYKFQYLVGTVTFVDRGPVTEVSVSNADDPSVNKNSITAIPIISNGTTYNWDTSSIFVEVYRTTNNGTEFFLVDTVVPTVTTFDDTVSDTTLQTHLALYTEGGVVENDTPPLAKLIHVTGDTCYYANIKTGTQLLSNRLMQAVPGDPDSVPGSFFVDVQDEIIGLSSTRGLPVLLCKNSVYRVDGQFDLTGQGGMVAVKISDTATCVSSQSVVQTNEGVFWAGDDSYYFTDGYQVIKLCQEWTASYRGAVQNSTQRARLQGAFDRKQRRIWWAIQSSTGGSADCDSCDILHLDAGIKGDAVFTSASGTYFNPTSIEFIDGNMIRGDRHGYLFIHEDGLTTDPKIDILATPSTWDTVPIVWDYASCAFNFGTSFVRKYVSRIVVDCLNKTNLSMQIVSISDDGRKVEKLKPIRFRGNQLWGDTLPTWGDSASIWGFSGLIENMRRFPSKSLRCSYKQIQLTNASVDIVNSDTLGTAAVNSTTKVVTLETGGMIWPTNLAGYTIAFSSDSYATDYPIVSRTSSTTITYLDSGSTSTTGAARKWVIRGVPKGEILYLLGYTIAFEFNGQTQPFYTASESGEVGT